MSHQSVVIAIVGYRRSRRWIFGTQARLLRVQDGALLVIDQDGTEQERVALAGAEVELKRGLVRVACGDHIFHLYGLASTNRVPPALLALAREQRAERAIGMPDGAIGAAAASREVLDVLVAHGAQSRST